VHGLILGPTPKPFALSKIILLSRYDFPVLYKPATEMTPMFPLMEFKKVIASSLMTNSKRFSWDSGIGFTVCFSVEGY